MKTIALQMKFFVFFVGLVLSGPLLRAQSLEWLNQIGGIADENVNDLKVDQQGNIYITGTFQYIADFDPGTAEFLLRSKGLSDYYVAKYDSLGNFIWANQFGSIYDENTDVSIEIDPSGTPFMVISGYYGNPVEFQSTNQSYKINSVDFTRGFIIKFDKNGSSGQLKYFNSKIISLTFDDKNNQYIQFAMESTILVTDGVWTNSLSLGPGTFLVKMANLVVIKWATRTGNALEFDDQIQVDQEGNVYTLSNFLNTISLTIGANTETFIAVGHRDKLLSKIDSSGKIIWVKQIVGVYNGNSQANLAIIGKELVLCGVFKERFIFDPQQEKKFLLSGSACSAEGFFLCKISDTGSFINLTNATKWISTGECLWSKRSLILKDKIYVYSSSDRVYVYKTDFSELSKTELKYSYSSSNFNMQAFKDRLIISADFQGKFDLDPTCRRVELTSNIQSKDIFLLRLNLTGSSQDIDSIIGKHEICFGDTLVLISPLVTNSSWSTGETGQSVAILQNQVGLNNIWVEGFNKDSCFVRYSIDVLVKPRPTITAINNTVICADDSAVLITKGATTYLWSTGQLDSAIVVKPNSTTQYSITATNSDGCSATRHFVVTVNPLPNVDAGTDQTICAGQQTLLTATGGQTYQWNNNGNQASTTVSPAATGTYTVTATDSNGCNNTDQVVVVVNPLPIADAGVDQTICQGDSAVLTATGGLSYEWNNSSASSSNTTYPMSTTQYVVTVTDVNGCSAIDAVQVLVQNRPNANAGADRSICLGDSVTLTASGGFSYAWSSMQNSPSTIVSPTIKTTYVVTVTASNGCSKTDVVVVNVFALPTANAGVDQTICAGKQAILVATGGQTYRWSNNSNQASTTVSPSTTTTYTVTATDSNGCKSADQVVVVVNPLPIADAGPDQTTCNGDTVFVEANGGVAYFWNNSNTTKSLIANPMISTSFIVTVTDANGCTASDVVNIKVNPKPEVDLLGIDTLKLKIGQFVILYAGKGEKFLWSTGDTTNTIVIDQNSSWYCVTVTNTFGCRGNDCLFVQFPPTANQEVDAATVSIYPNPAQDFLTIVKRIGSVLPYDLQVFTTLGQSVKQTKNNTIDQQNLDISDLPAGNYFVHLKFDGYTVVEQVVVRRY